MWEEGLDPASVKDADPRAPHLHILMSMEGSDIMAGMVWEYYPVSNCVLVCGVCIVNSGISVLSGQQFRAGVWGVHNNQWN